SVANVVIKPADGLMLVPENTMGFGGPRFVWFNRLKNSVLNCNRTRSVSAVFFSKDTSTVCSPGPRSVPRPTLPHVLTVGRESAFGSNHCVCFFSSTGPVNDGFTSGRSGFLVLPSPDRFAPTCGVNGKPLSNVVMTFSCHPPVSLAKPLAVSFPKG